MISTLNFCRKVCQIFYFPQMCKMKISLVHFSIQVNSSNSLFGKFLWPAMPARGGLNKDPTVWLDGARSANTCIQLSFPEHTQAAAHRTHPKNGFASIKNLQNLVKSLFIKPKNDISDF